jgi:hypothetical protein
MGGKIDPLFHEPMTLHLLIAHLCWSSGHDFRLSKDPWILNKPRETRVRFPDREHILFAMLEVVVCLGVGGVGDAEEVADFLGGARRKATA